MCLADSEDVAACMKGQLMRGTAEILAKAAGLESKADNQQIGS